MKNASPDLAPVVAEGPIVVTFDKHLEARTNKLFTQDRTISDSNFTAFTEEASLFSLGDCDSDSSQEHMVGVHMEPSLDDSASVSDFGAVVKVIESVRVVSSSSELSPQVLPAEVNLSDEDDTCQTALAALVLEGPAVTATTAVVGSEAAVIVEDSVGSCCSNSSSDPQPPIVTTTQQRRPSIKRYNPEEIPVHDHRSSWKQLPKPDLDLIRATSAPAVLISDDVERVRTRTIRFHEVQTRAYRQTLGDNPSVSYGPPISLDWEYEEIPAVDLEEFELNRGLRRNMRQMMMNYYVRKNLLTWSCGASEQELKKAEKEANKIKRSRSITRSLLPAQKLEEAVQSVARKTRRWSKRGTADSEMTA